MCLTCVPSSWARVALLKSLSSLRPSQCSFHKAKHRLNLYHSPYLSRIFRNLLIVFRFCQYFAILTSDESDVSIESGNSWESGDYGESEISTKTSNSGVYNDSSESGDFLETHNSGGSGESGDSGDFDDTDNSVDPGDSSDSGEYGESG